MVISHIQKNLEKPGSLLGLHDMLFLSLSLLKVFFPPKEPLNLESLLNSECTKLTTLKLQKCPPHSIVVHPMIPPIGYKIMYVWTMMPIFFTESFPTRHYSKKETKREKALLKNENKIQVLLSSYLLLSYNILKKNYFSSLTCL